VMASRAGLAKSTSPWSQPAHWSITMALTHSPLARSSRPLTLMHRPQYESCQSLSGSAATWWAGGSTNRGQLPNRSQPWLECRAASIDTYYYQQADRVHRLNG
jgi:hypothetical protein